MKDLLTVGAVVAVTNLQWRHDVRNRLPTVTANELSVFSVKSWQPYQATAVQKLEALLKVRILTDIVSLKVLTLSGRQSTIAGCSSVMMHN